MVSTKDLISSLLFELLSTKLIHSTFEYMDAKQFLNWLTLGLNKTIVAKMFDIEKINF